MPRLGLLADSHGHAAPTRLGVRILLDAGAEQLIHLGDIGTESVIDELVTEVETRIVFGNTDWNWQPLARYAEHVGLFVDHPVGRLKLDGKLLVYQHGDHRQAMAAAVAQQAAYLCHGHTHVAADDRIGSAVSCFQTGTPLVGSSA